tara:strand:+ start:215 stop:421 length:207 start_codon:yes stop_codon:yes gene_type:complete
MDDYEEMDGDCSGNNIDLYQNSDLDKCKEICNNNKECKGFSISSTNCIPKTVACDNPTPSNYKFYKKP